MATHSPLAPATPWVEVAATEQDWDQADPKLLTSMLSQLALIRSFEEYVLVLAGKGLIHGPAHSSIGQEGGAGAGATRLRPRGGRPGLGAGEARSGAGGPRPRGQP